jgi:hypothetical protein
MMRATDDTAESSNPIYRFLFASVGLFVVLLVGWYLIAGWLTAPLAPLAKRIVDLWVPGLILAVQRPPDSAIFEFVTTLRSQNAAGQIQRFVVNVNPLVYGYGLPLFFALMLASRAKGLVWKLPLGAVILLIPQLWGVSFDFMLNTITQVPRAALLELNLFGWKRELIGLGYQLGSLILPIVTPVVLWFLMNRTFVYAVVFSGALDEKKTTLQREQTHAQE